MRSRTIQWFEGRIIDVLSRQHKINSALEIQGIRSIEEVDIVDIAVEYLISKGIVTRTKCEGVTFYELAA